MPLLPYIDLDDVAADAADRLGISKALAAEVMYENDDGGPFREGEDWRWRRMRGWVVENLNQPELKK